MPEFDDENTRELIAYSYRIIYAVEPDQVIIAAVIPGKRIALSLRLLIQIPSSVIACSIPITTANHHPSHSVQYETSLPPLLAHTRACRPPKSGHSNLGDHMHGSRHYIASLFLTASLAAPLSLMAAPRPQEVGVQVRVYDKQHKDYHNWDDNENRAWGQYLAENHRDAHEYSKSNKREQSQYWSWRHAHPDDRDHQDRH